MHIKIELLDRLIPDKTIPSVTAGTLAAYLTKVAQLGGYLARTKDPPPGNSVMWRGLSRLININLGYMLARTSAGYG